MSKILEKFERLRKCEAMIALDKERYHPSTIFAAQERRYLATELEEWARAASAGEVLDQVCSGWMSGWADEFEIVWYSTDPAAAMELLEAMRPIWSLSPCEDGGWVMLPTSSGMLSKTGGNRMTWPRAERPMLAIARACAVLAARGITREGS